MKNKKQKIKAVDFTTAFLPLLLCFKIKHKQQQRYY